MTARDADRPSVAIVGTGVVGERVRRNLSTSFRLLPRDLTADIVVLATPSPHATEAARLVAAGTHVVSTSGAIDDAWGVLPLAARGVVTEAMKRLHTPKPA